MWAGRLLRCFIYFNLTQSYHVQELLLSLLCGWQSWASEGLSKWPAVTQLLHTEVGPCTLNLYTMLPLKKCLIAFLSAEEVIFNPNFEGQVGANQAEERRRTFRKEWHAPQVSSICRKGIRAMPWREQSWRGSESQGLREVLALQRCSGFILSAAEAVGGFMKGNIFWIPTLQLSKLSLFPGKDYNKTMVT